jgi:predicted metal-dependent enzyme (double-stranded beta helix superfamily)
LALRVIAEFLTRTVTALHRRGVSEASLAAVAEDLRRLAAELALPPADFPPAGPGQERVYELAEDPGGGAALYLVSDAPCTVSPPHEHLTWAVIVGIRGVEANTLYRITDPERREVEVCGEAAVGAGQALVLPEGAIHSTAVLGPTATYHLHLYGKPLRSLPPFGERTYVFTPTA